MQESAKIEVVGRYAAMLSVVEVALGSLLHAFHVPFAGNFLSLNQGYLLCRATLSAEGLAGARGIPYSVSNVAAVLKSLAPAGKKLGPMLSLSAQGLLFSLGTGIFGAGFFGLALGMALLSVWTFLQPLLTYYLFFGGQLFAAGAYLFEKTLPGVSASALLWVFAFLVLGKMVVAVGLAFFAWKTHGRADLQDKLLAFALSRGARPLAREARGPAFMLAIRDLFRPLFLASLAITGFFLYFAQGEGARTIWLLLRPVAIAFLFFYFSRTLTLDRWLVRLEGGRWHGFSLSCRLALERVRRISGA